jgi:hypothetical protein
MAWLVLAALIQETRTTKVCAFNAFANVHGG